jgi:hypothetical protein
MYMTDNTNIIEENIFNGGELVFTKNSDGSVIGGGYKITSEWLEGGMSPILTLNGSEQNGGKVSSPFENLAVPAGLFYVNMRVSKKNMENTQYKRHDTIPDDMIDKLYSLVEFDNKRKRKTRKTNIKSHKSKTRRAK